MKVMMDFSDYRPWSGAQYTYDVVDKAGKLAELEQLAEECLGETVKETALNDFLWFERDFIFESLGIDEYPDEVAEE